MGRSRLHNWFAVSINDLCWYNGESLVRQRGGPAAVDYLTRDEG
jgi:hypothetical protein